MRQIWLYIAENSILAVYLCTRSTPLGGSVCLCMLVRAGHLCNMFQTLMWWLNEMHYDLLNVIGIYAILEDKEKFKA